MTNVQLPMFLKEDFMKALHAGEKMDCPCCGRHAQIYKRRLHSSVVRFLIGLYRLGADKEYVNYRQVVRALGLTDVCDFGKAKYWGLIEAKENVDDAKQTSGYWRLTHRGVNFILGKGQEPEFAFVFDDVALGFSDNLVDVQHALGKKFNYTELMEA